MSAPDVRLPDPPERDLAAAIEAAAAELEAAGRPAAAEALRRARQAWSERQRGWTAEIARALSVHHDVNNALVGVRGNAQLLDLGPLGQAGPARERLDVILRESDRIRDAAQRIHALKQRLTAVIHDSETQSSSRAA